MASERAEDAKGGDTGILLGVLSAVERDSQVTQRHLARELGIALGLANAYFKRCAKKGLIKIRQAPFNRYAYYLTPHGFAEKSRLTAEYLATSFDFFRRARRDCTAVLSACGMRNWRRAILYGAGELAEIAVLSAGEAGVEIVCVLDLAGGEGSCAGRRAVPDFASAVTLAGSKGIDVVVVTDLRAPQETFAAAAAEAGRHGIPAERVVAPSLLRVVPGANGVSS